MASGPPNIALITGPTLIGLCLNWGFMGVSAVQIYFYFSNFPNDRKGIKSLVYGLSFLDFLQTCMTTADAFHWFVYGFGDIENLDTTFLNPWDMVMLDTIIGFIVQLFYCWRIYVLRKTLAIPVIISLISITAFGGGLATAVKSYQLGKLSLVPTLITTQTIWIGGAVAADILIAAAVSWTLLKATRNSIAASQGTIARIIRLTVETNALTAGLALITLILFLGVPKKATLIVPPVAILGKLYFNCLMAVLNNRLSSRGESSGFSGSRGVQNGSIIPVNASRIPIPDSGVHITRTQKVHMDPLDSRSFGPVMEDMDMSDMSVHKPEHV
ncbi:hypothetical protein C8R44DRAFT_789321 [Mycena epipterygia]|nr:hypothetical protein C8R44DRAFT_789321 [Mycena epipterygia]